MTSSRPYLIRAIYDWITDNGMTPYLLVNARKDGVSVPHKYVDNGKIVLNIASGAVAALHLGNDYIGFNARFGGVSMELMIPVSAVMAIYARENGQGMMFNENDNGGGDGALPDGTGSSNGTSRSHLKVVK